MSLAGLVQYDSSDDSDNESNNENISESVKTENILNDDKYINPNTSKLNNVTIGHQERKLLLPDPIKKCERLGTTDIISTDNSSTNLFLNSLPKPKSIQINDEIEEDDISVNKITQFVVEKPPKKQKGRVKISIPSLSDFDDIDEKANNSRVERQPSTKLPGVLSLLPPPKGEAISTANLIPHVLTKTTNKNTPLVPIQIKSNTQNRSNIKNNVKVETIKTSNALNSLNYDSNSDDEDEEISTKTSDKTIDFFSLSEPVNLPLSEEIVAANILPLDDNENSKEPMRKTEEIIDSQNENSNTILTSTVMDLPKNEILLKNKAEVGPKLPVPEQEFNVDAEGNVAFDDKAIEYLCGKRGVKRKNQIINENEIIDINGEDIKPDEREWLVKALTEEPVRRPVSMGSGPSGQSKKKHQITYLAHQAKAMEIELQNQWAASNMTRKQTRSKYGF